MPDHWINFVESESAISLSLSLSHTHTHVSMHRKRRFMGACINLQTWHTVDCRYSARNQAMSIHHNGHMSSACYKYVKCRCVSAQLFLRMLVLHRTNLRQGGIPCGGEVWHGLTSGVRARHVRNNGIGGEVRHYIGRFARDVLKQPCNTSPPQGVQRINLRQGGMKPFGTS